MKKYSRKEVVRSIFAYWEGSMTDDQKKEFCAWLGLNRKNQKLFDRLQDAKYVKERWHEYQGYDSVEDWKKIQVKLQVPCRKMGRWMRVCAASAAILLCVGMAWYFAENNVTDGKANSAVVDHGNSKAMLFLATGEVIELESTQNTKHVRVEGECFVNDGKKLVYSDTAGIKEVKWHTLQVPRGGEFILCLADGTVVTLNADSKIHYPDHFTEEERQVTLEGEAFFEVAKDSLKPFVVKAEGMDVRVLGTIFNLKAYPDENQQTTLVQGAVEVLSDKQQVLLKAGEQVTRVGEELKVGRVDVRPYIAWKDERFVFENEPLEGVLKKLERWYNVTVLVRHSSLLGMRFTGNLPKYESINKVLNMLALTTNIKFELKDRTLVVQLE